MCIICVKSIDLMDINKFLLLMHPMCENLEETFNDIYIQYMYYT